MGLSGPNGGVRLAERVFYHTFGCKANQYDTDRIRRELESRGARTAPDLGGATVCVVNTCAVTHRAEAEARRFVQRLGRERRDLAVVVVGCSAALHPGVYRGLGGVAAVVGGHDPARVFSALGAEGARRLPVLPPSPAGGLAPRRAARAPSGAARPAAGFSRRNGRGEVSRGWLKIQDGCDRRCSFCATRLARGKSRSRPPGEIVDEARLLGLRFPEIVLTGIHIGHYGRDLPRPFSLSRLVALLLEQVEGVRFRLGSVEATEVDDLLLELMATSGGALAPHLHMPLQSGSDRVLSRMRRWHTGGMYRKRALEIAGRLPVLGLGADVIAGFPGEGEEDHRATLALVEELPFTYLHVFPFSPRPGTPAAQLAEHVPAGVAAERSRELRELGAEKGRAYRLRQAGRRAVGVLEGGGGWALTEDYLRVRVEGGADEERGLVRGELAWRGEDLVLVGSGGALAAGNDLSQAMAKG